jgi:hypothetical protein
MGDSEVTTGRPPAAEEVAEAEVEAEVGEDAGWQEKPEPRPGERKDDFEPESKFHG